MTAFPADPALEALHVDERGLTELPDDLPQRLPRVRILDLDRLDKLDLRWGGLKLPATALARLRERGVVVRA